MARRGRSDDAPIVVASAAAVRLFEENPEELSDRAKRIGYALAWQHEAWKWYGRLGEVWYSHAWKGNAIGGLHWLIGTPDSKTGDLIPARGVDGTLAAGVDEQLFQLAQDALDRLVGPNGSHSEWARPLGTSISCVAEGWLLGYHVDDEGNPVDGTIGEGDFAADNPEAVMIVWDACSPTELDKVNGEDGKPRLRVQRTAEGDPTTLPRDALAVRIWRRHPRWSEDADGPMEPLIDVCEDLYLLRMSVRGSALSRTHAGLLLIPTEGLGQPLSAYANQQSGGAASSGQGPPPNPVITEIIAGLATPHRDPASAAAVVPTAITTKGDHIEKWKHLPLTRDIDPMQKEQREELIRAYATGIDLPPERLLGMASLNHWCHDETTEVYGEHGWVGIDNFEVGMRLLTLDHATGSARWAATSDVYRADVVDEPMVSIEGRYHSSLTTKDHSWPVVVPRKSDGVISYAREWQHSSDFLTETRSAPSRPRMLLAAPVADHPEAKLTDALVELLAWASTDADLTPGARRRVRIRQRKTADVAAIRVCLAGVEHSEHPDPSAGVVSFRLSADASEVVLGLGTVAGNRFVVAPSTVDMFTASQRELFLATCERANGGDTDHRTVFAVDPERLAAVERAAILAGYRTTMRQRNQQHGFGTEPVWRCTWGTRTVFAPGPEHVAEFDYTGRIWCPTVPGTHTVLARRNGTVFWTGQTAWQVGEDSWRHVDPDARCIAGGLSAGYLWPDMIAALEEADPTLEITAEVLERVRAFRITYDPTPVIISPDRSEDADAALAAGAISWAAYRRYKHIPETDAPTVEELEERALLGFGGRPPAPAGGPGDVVEGPAQSAQPGADTAASVRAAIRARQTVRASLRVTGQMERYARACARIETGFLRDVLLAVDASVDEAVRKAQARLRSLAQRDSQLRARIAGVPNCELVSIIGRREVTRLRATFEGEDDATAEGLFAGTLALLLARYHELSTAARREWLRVTTEMLGLEFEADELAALEADLIASGPVLETGARQAAEAAFLGGAAAAVLLDGPGEVPAGVRIPPVVVRRAAARAGGAPIAGGIAPMEAGWEGGMTSGPTIAQFLERRGFVAVGLVWDYGSPTSRKDPYLPHLELSGVEAAALEDYLGFYPGDHGGCQCTIGRLYATDDGDEAKVTSLEPAELP